MKWSIDPHPIARRGSAEIVCISVMHLYFAALLIGWPETQGSTSIIAMQRWGSLPGYSRGLLVIELLVAILLAMAGVLGRIGWPRIACFLPQHYLLGVMAYGGFAATFQGAYLDTTIITLAAHFRRSVRFRHAFRDSLMGDLS